MTRPTKTAASRERLRWQRATDALLIDAIFPRVIRDVPLPASGPCLPQSGNATPATSLPHG